MAVYINGRAVNPIASFVVSVLAVAVTVGLVILLLPIIGGILLLALVAVVALMAYGAYYRWKNADAIRQMQQNINAAFGGAGMSEEPQEAAKREFRTAVKTKTGVKRTSTVDDAVVVEEIRHIRIEKTE